MTPEQAADLTNEIYAAKNPPVWVPRSMSNNTQQAQAVTNTLAGERLVTTVAFPTTGDTEMDFIAALVAVWEALPLHPVQALRAVEYFRSRVAAKAREREAVEKHDMRARTEEAWLEKKRQELMHRIQAQQGLPGSPPGQIISKWTTSDKSAGIPDFTTSSGMPGYLAGAIFAVHKNPDGSETRVPYGEYLSNLPPHPPGTQAYHPAPDGSVPLPHPPEFAAAIQARELERLLAQDKVLDPKYPSEF